MNTQQQQQLSGALTRILGLCFCAILVVVALTFGADAQDLETRFLRIGTGSPGGTYFPIGNAIAEAISAPIDTVDCSGNDDACVAGLMAVARASFGAVENLANVRNGLIESGFVQSDLAHWATHGEA
ncbi:MAG: TAXI family TRAP transporter solute-binding subunit, partial [Pseudomonadota bacterium]